MDLKNSIDKNNLPKHVAIIMDGNGRWAKKQGKLRIFGHNGGVKSVRDTVEGAAEIGIKYLTMYAFSTENWNRPKLEVDALMALLVSSLKDELTTLNKNNIKLNSIGDTSKLPLRVQKNLASVIDQTKNNSRMTLTLALNYGSKSEILTAVKSIASKAKNNELNIDDITESLFSENLYTSNMPDVDLLIRTSGETRISNFLLWQIAYAELIFIEKLWPDFRKDDLFEAILNYQNKERRFGKTSEQLNP
ncbi:MAG: isoprenyl transferase [Ichthyobacteriaceae bacterium]|nr:isoprenyl transferase [Ichthyobacteriaceae bacterium]